jgi:hypothetical protein
MPSSRFSVLRDAANPLNARVQDNINQVLGPLAKAVMATPIMGAPPPPWIRPDLRADFVPTANFAVPGYFKDCLGFVHLKGSVTTAAGAGIGTVIFQLPMGYRPAEYQRFSVEGTLSTYQCLQIGPDGFVVPAVAIGAGGNTFLTLSFLGEV